MNKNFTIMETREMNKHELEAELVKCCERLEALGMKHEDACGFVSSIMNIGISIQEKFDLEKLYKEYSKYKDYGEWKES